MSYAGTMPQGYAYLSDGAAMACARDALAAARADFRRMVCEVPTARTASGGRDARDRAAYHAGYHARGHAGNPPMRHAEGPRLAGRGALRQISLPAVAGTGGGGAGRMALPGNGPGNGSGNGGVNGSGTRVAAASGAGSAAHSSARISAVAPRAGGRRRGGGFSLSSAEYIFIVAVMGLAIVAAGLELMGQ